MTMAVAGIDALELEARVGGIPNRWPTVGLAVGVVRDRRLEFFSGHGLADIATSSPVTQDTVFRIASVTTTFTAIAVLQLWEQGWSTWTPRPTTTCVPTSWSRPRPASGPRPCASC
jgi:CubicO group peptidase (beta-lactamase class C family)